MSRIRSLAKYDALKILYDQVRSPAYSPVSSNVLREVERRVITASQASELKIYIKFELKLN